MSDYFSARDRIEAWIKAFEKHHAPPERLAVADHGEVLLLSDIKTLLEKLAGPCGSCHPCENYADETWRAADRKPPHVYEYDELTALVRHLDDGAPELLARALRANGWQKTRHTFTWDGAHEATRRRLTHEARTLIAAMLTRSENEQ